MQECKYASILSWNIFDPNLTWPKLFQTERTQRLAHLPSFCELVSLPLSLSHSDRRHFLTLIDHDDDQETKRELKVVLNFWDVLNTLISQEVRSQLGQRLPGLWEATCKVKSGRESSLRKARLTTPPWRLLATRRAKSPKLPRIPGSRVGRRGWGASTRSNSCQKRVGVKRLFFLSDLTDLPVATKGGNRGKESEEWEKGGGKGSY